MNVFIICDMEGIAGINHWDQVQARGYLYHEGRTLYTEEVNAAIRGARAAGATNITVLDGHGAGGIEPCCKFNSLRPDLIDPDVTLITGNRYLKYTDIMREGAFDCALFVGIHSMENTPRGVLAHTISSTVWEAIWINDTKVGEIGVMSALVGEFGIPMAMIAGDRAACDEGIALLGDNIVTASVKEGTSRFSAKHIPPVRARQLVEEAATKAVRNAANVKPYVLEGEVRVRYLIKSIDQIDVLFRNRVGITINEDALTIKSTGSSFSEAWFKAYPW